MQVQTGTQRNPSLQHIIILREGLQPDTAKVTGGCDLRQSESFDTQAGQSFLE